MLESHRDGGCDESRAQDEADKLSPLRVAIPGILGQENAPDIPNKFESDSAHDPGCERPCLVFDAEA